MAKELKVFIGCDSFKGKNEKSYNVCWLGSPVFKGCGLRPDQYFFVGDYNTISDLSFGTYVSADLKIEGSFKDGDRKATCFSINKL